MHSLSSGEFIFRSSRLYFFPNSPPNLAGNRSGLSQRTLTDEVTIAMLFVTALPFPVLPTADHTLLSVYPRTCLRAAPAPAGRPESHQQPASPAVPGQALPRWGYQLPAPRGASRHSNPAPQRAWERAGTVFHKPCEEKQSPEQKNNAGCCSVPAIKK